MKMVQVNIFATNQKIYIRYTLAALVWIFALFNMFSTFTRDIAWRVLFEAWPIDTRYHITVSTIIVSYFLLIVPYGLLRGKRQAWRITMLLLLTTILLDVVRGSVPILTAVAIALFVVLLIFDYCFEARSDPPSIVRGYIATAFGLGIVVVYTFGGFVALYSNLHLPTATQSFVFGRALPLLCLCAFLFGVVQILRPVARILLPDTKQRETVTTLVDKYGSNSISYFALDADKSYFFSASGKAVISYVMKMNVAVVAGDPIGSDEDLYAVVNEFVAFCRKQDWTPAFWQVRDEWASLYRKCGFQLLKIGEDAIIQTETFTLKGKAMSNVRTSARRAEKEGVHIVFYHGEIENADYLAQLAEISRKWLEEKGDSEMGFSMGHFEFHPAKEQVTAIAVDNAEQVHAFVTFLPIYGRHGWGLDLMRRAEKTAPGCMELLLSCSIDYLKDQGGKMVSLGLAPMGNVNQDEHSSVKNIVDFLTHRFGNLSQSQSLFKFKEKFHPTWESRYLVYTNSLVLPQLGLALFAAHQPDASWLAVLRASIQDWLAKRAERQRSASQALRPIQGQAN